MSDTEIPITSKSPEPASEVDAVLLAILGRFADRVQSIEIVVGLGDRELRHTITLAPAEACPPPP